ncbi:MAG: acetyl-CoA carboxylase carboxyltransferase subunit beta [Alphaproteobacteria bacterium]|nr:acetyl-CoA carboxylase carboxyltransferase subunit beta [Alphaproteobacteria bacterium]MCB9792584.1 acetyl-CoA carboxylase carboxyltransferase subunit beta [Alphaproteobacteria bacterium]
MGKRWFEQEPKPLRSRPPSEAGPSAASDKDLWLRCPTCSEILFRPTLAERFEVCSRCSHHFRLAAPRRVDLLIDPGSWVRHDADVAPTDPLEFVDSKPYAQRLQRTQAKVGENDAFLAGSCTMGGLPVELGVFEFRFMGGSMGSVVGELITRQFERAARRGCPAIVVSASGGARMQEGILSLMQMAKTCAALAKLRDEAHQPYISVLTHPTTGGVAASFAMLGDIILAEPDALIGFAGPRVIKQTIGEDLPEGFQTSEYLLEHGMVDRIVQRDTMRDTIIELLSWMGTQPLLTDGAEEGA